MSTIQKWFASHSISTHTLASAWVAATALWYTNKDFKDYVWGIYVALPRSVHGVIAGVVIPALLYWQAKKHLTNQVSTEK